MVGEKMIYEERTFITEQQIMQLLDYFEKNASQKREEKQVIYDYHTEGNFRLIKTKNYVKIDFKPNSAIEKENQVYITKQYENDLTNIFTKIGLSIDLKRFRIKFHYETELEKATKLEELSRIFQELSIEKTDISKFEELYAKYRMDWYDLTKDIDEQEFLK